MAAASPTLEPSSGYIGTVITVKCTGLAKNVAGWVWFDSDKDGVKDTGEPQVSATTTVLGTLPAGTTLTAPAMPAGVYPVRIDVPSGTPIEASADFTLYPPSISLNPTSGTPGTEITIEGGGFATSTAGWVWFDTNGDSIKDGTEPQALFTTTAGGAIPSGLKLTVPAVPAGSFFVRADIPEGSPIEASEPFTVNPGITLSPAYGVMNTVPTITVTGGGFATSTVGYIWFDTDGDSFMDATEPQTSVTTTTGGALPSGTTLSTPLLPPNSTCQVRADIPSGGSIEASATYTVVKVTTALIVTKYDPYGTVLDQTTIDYATMESTLGGQLPVQGDGEQHYWLQGPVLPDECPGTDIWDPDETCNIKDWGASKGTDLKDLCELVGGMSPGDTVEVKASDGLRRSYDYPNVYTPNPEQGKMVICWYTKGGGEMSYPDGAYVPEFGEGMRLIFFAETTNSEGKYVFGNWDQHECFPESRWYFYDGEYPTTTGHSIKYVYEINIYQPKLVACDSAGNKKDSFAPGETVYVKGLGLDASTSYKLWIQDEPVIKDDALNAGEDPSGAQETVTTDGNGDFGPTATWAISSSATEHEYDIVADNQASGTVGTYDNADEIDSPGWEGFSVTFTEYISFTVTTYDEDGIIFGDLDPGETGAAEYGGGVGAATITVGSETNVDVDIQVKGDYFTANPTGTIPIGNVQYDSDDDPGGASTLTDSYETSYTIGADTYDQRQVYYWISIPPGQPAGDYNSTFYYQAVESS